MQEVIDHARPAYMDDWTEFTRAAFAISREAFADFIAAQAAGGASAAGEGHRGTAAALT